MTALSLPAQARTDTSGERSAARAQSPGARINNPTVRVRLAAAAGRLTQDEPQSELAPAEEPRVHPKLQHAARLLEAIVRDALEEASDVEWKLEIALEIVEPDSQPFPFLVHSEPQLVGGRPWDPASNESPPYEHWERPIRGLPDDPGEPLTESEKRVLRYLPTNLSVKEIAGELYVSANTVKTHIRHIYAKLDASNRSDAVDRARALQLLASRTRRPHQILVR